MSADTPWMTIVMCLLAVLFTVVGGIVAIANPDTLSFEQYLERMGQLALAVSALGFGRSLKKGLAGAPTPGVTPSLNERPIMTITVGVIVLVAGGVGGAITIADPATLDFNAYLDKMTTFAYAIGIQGFGRAVRKGLQQREDDGSALEAHPDHPANPVDLGVATVDGDEESFIDPEDLADELLGADDDPDSPVTALLEPEANGNGADLDLELDAGVFEDGLPSDADEDLAPPPDVDEDLATAIADFDVLEIEDEPNVLMPSQEEEPAL